MGRSSARPFAVAVLAAGLALTGCSKADDAPVTKSSTPPRAAGVDLRGVRTAKDVDARFAAYSGPYEATVWGSAGPAAATSVSRRDESGTYSLEVSEQTTGQMKIGAYAEVYRGDRCVERESAGGVDGDWGYRTLPAGDAWSTEAGLGALLSPEGAAIDGSVAKETLEVSSRKVTVVQLVTVEGSGEVFSRFTSVYTLDGRGVVRSAELTDMDGKVVTGVRYRWSVPAIKMPDAAFALGPESDGCRTVKDMEGTSESGSGEDGGDGTAAGAPSTTVDEHSDGLAYEAANGIAAYAVKYAKQVGLPEVDDNAVRTAMTGRSDSFDASALRRGRVEVTTMANPFDVACITFTGESYSVVSTAC